MKTLEHLTAGPNKVEFISKTMGGDLKLSGVLFLPDNFNVKSSYPTVVFTGPFNQVKEQMGTFYGKKLAKQGYVFLAFDHQGYGESEGYIRNYEYFPAKLEGIQDAISFLNTLSFVDSSQLYGIGACAGASHMAYVALTDKRLKKVAFVSGMLSNTAVHHVFTKKGDLSSALNQSNLARQAYYQSNQLVPSDVLKMSEAEDSKLRDVREDYDYYMTERAGAVTYPNYSEKTPEFFIEDNARYSARAIARFITTPTLTIYGTKASTKLFSWLFHFAKKGPKQRVTIKGASHVDLYDIDQYVDTVTDHLTTFFK